MQDFIAGAKKQGFASKTATVVRGCCLAASSLVVMGSAVRTFTTSESDCGREDLFGAQITYCRSIDVALSVGAVGSALAIVVVGFALMCRKRALPLPVETATSFLLLALWGCGGIGYISRRFSPGSTINNLFIATWVSFVITIFWFGNCVGEWTYGRTKEANGEKQDSPPEEDV